jgi:hypothetical protein
MRQKVVIKIIVVLCVLLLPTACVKGSQENRMELRRGVNDVLAKSADKALDMPASFHPVRVDIVDCIFQLGFFMLVTGPMPISSDWFGPTEPFFSGTPPNYSRPDRQLPTFNDNGGLPEDCIPEDK